MSELSQQEVFTVVNCHPVCHSQFASDANYASLVVGFPELEFSSNEVYAWPKSDEAIKYVVQFVDFEVA